MGHGPRKVGLVVRGRRKGAARACATAPAPGVPARADRPSPTVVLPKPVGSDRDDWADRDAKDRGSYRLSSRAAVRCTVGGRIARDRRGHLDPRPPALGHLPSERHVMALIYPDHRAPTPRVPDDRTLGRPVQARLGPSSVHRDPHETRIQDLQLGQVPDSLGVPIPVGRRLHENPCPHVGMDDPVSDAGSSGTLAASPALAVAGVLNRDAPSEQLVPDLVGTSPLPGIPGCLASGQEQGRLRIEFRRRIGQQSEYAIEIAKHIDRVLCVLGREDPGIKTPIQLADEIEKGSQAGRHVQIVVERCLKRASRTGEDVSKARVICYGLLIGRQRRDEGVQSVYRGAGCRKRRLAVLEALTVMDGDQSISERSR